MRLALAAALVVTMTSSAAAQSRADRSIDELPRPSIGLPLPQIGLPLAPIGLPPPTSDRFGRAERFERSEGTGRPDRPERSDRRGRSGRSGGGAVFFVPAFGWPYPFVEGTPAPSAPFPESVPQTYATGRVRLDIASAVDPQIYVDEYYVGLMSDSRGELTLDAGRHTIELREEGYENLRIDVQVAPDGVTTFRGAMKSINAGPRRSPDSEPRRPSEPEPPPPAPSTIYMIPGCYVGNVAPKDALLPAGCDAGRAIAFPSRP